MNTRNRKLKPKRRRPVYLESAEQIAAMIDAANAGPSENGRGWFRTSDLSRVKRQALRHGCARIDGSR